MLTHKEGMQAPNQWARTMNCHIWHSYIVLLCGTVLCCTELHCTAGMHLDAVALGALARAGAAQYEQDGGVGGQVAIHGGDDEGGIVVLGRRGGHGGTGVDVRGRGSGRLHGGGSASV